MRSIARCVLPVLVGPSTAVIRPGASLETMAERSAAARLNASWGRVNREAPRYDRPMSSNGKRGRPPHADILTPGEWRIVEAVRHGMTSREIAERRGISIDAVKYHVANALMKLGLANRAELRQWDGVARGSALFGRETEM